MYRRSSARGISSVPSNIRQETHIAKFHLIMILLGSNRRVLEELKWTRNGCTMDELRLDLCCGSPRSQPQKSADKHAGSHEPCSFCLLEGLRHNCEPCAYVANSHASWAYKRVTIECDTASLNWGRGKEDGWKASAIASAEPSLKEQDKREARMLDYDTSENNSNIVHGSVLALCTGYGWRDHLLQ